MIFFIKLLRFLVLIDFLKNKNFNKIIMPKTREFTDFERGEIVGLSKGDFSYGKIAEILDIPKYTVSEIVKKYNEQGLTTTAPHSDRPKILSEYNKK
jgi:transposase